MQINLNCKNMLIILLNFSGETKESISKIIECFELRHRKIQIGAFLRCHFTDSKKFKIVIYQIKLFCQKSKDNFVIDIIIL